PMFFNHCFRQLTTMAPTTRWIVGIKAWIKRGAGHYVPCYLPISTRAHSSTRYIIFDVSSPQGFLALAFGLVRIARAAILVSLLQDLGMGRITIIRCGDLREKTTERRASIEDCGNMERTFCPPPWHRNAPFQASGCVLR
ncbi:unnamed protein product, partial [Mycena citricolor]